MTNKLKNLIASTVAVIDRRGRIRSDGRPVNPQTVDHTRRFMSNACHSLHEMGFYLEDIKGLSEKHVKALVKHWHSKHQGGDALTSQLSQLHMFCGWMGRAGLIRAEGLPFYLPDVDPDELKLATDYLTTFRAKLAAKKLPADQAWPSLSRALLGANEFLYVD